MEINNFFKSPTSSYSQLGVVFNSAGETTISKVALQSSISIFQPTQAGPNLHQLLSLDLFIGNQHGVSEGQRTPKCLMSLLLLYH